MFKIEVINCSYNCEDCGWITSFDVECYYNNVKKIFCHDGHFGNGELNYELFSSSNLIKILEGFEEELSQDNIEIIEFSTIDKEDKTFLIIKMKKNNIEKIFEYCTYDEKTYEDFETEKFFEEVFSSMGINFSITYSRN